MIITEKQMVDEGLADVSHGGQLRDQRDSRLKCRATTDGSVEPVESFDPNDLFAQGCLPVHQISDRV
jgi:hypothetical protein